MQIDQLAIKIYLLKNNGTSTDDICNKLGVGRHKVNSRLSFLNRFMSLPEPPVKPKRTINPFENASTRLCNILREANICLDRHGLMEVSKKPLETVLGYRGCGNTTVGELNSILSRYGYKHLKRARCPYCGSLNQNFSSKER